MALVLNRCEHQVNGGVLTFLTESGRQTHTRYTLGKAQAVLESESPPAPCPEMTTILFLGDDTHTHSLTSQRAMLHDDLLFYFFLT